MIPLVPLPRIHQLSPALVNRIAAGEVIERPASVVKELVENSIDAGATHITVEVEDGGLSLIRIIDDGAGMPADDLPLAFASHATSKITSDEDLFAIATMGFRGEALASIGAVSHARILSRSADADGTGGVAYEIEDRGGAISDPQAAAGNRGTVTEVRSLFFNTPARRKFLKGPGTEMGHISEMVQRLALPHPGIAFRLSHNGRVVTDLPATAEIDRLLTAWPAEFAEQRLSLDAADAEITLRGIIGLPETARPTAKYQYIYLNGRAIRDKFIGHALKEAYRGLTEPGRQPAAILMITMPPADVDVNVHPTKSEVRFKNSGRIHGLVLSAVRERLLGSDLTPMAVPHADGGGAGGERASLREKLAAFFRQAPVEAEGERGREGEGETRRAEILLPPVSEYPSGGRLAFGSEVRSQKSEVSTKEGEERTSNIEHPTSNIEGGESGGATERRSDEGLEAAHLQPSASSRQPPSSASRLKPTAVPAIQLHNAYLVAESQDGLIIIDQHALHERIMYEDLRARLSRGPLESQRMLIPVVVEASARQMDLLDQIGPLLGRLGIELSAMGPNTLAIQSFPTFLDRLEPSRFVQELLERGEQELLDLTDEELLHEILDMMACKAAIKAGDPLTPGEIEALLARRHLVERSSNCPHGRPTTLRLSLRDLEKQFKRAGF